MKDCPVPGCENDKPKGYVLCPHHWRATPAPFKRAFRTAETFAEQRSAISGAIRWLWVDELPFPFEDRHAAALPVPETALLSQSVSQ